MVTVGGTISGYWEIGSVTIEIPPQMIISKAMVAAKIGLLMKKSSKVIVHGYGVRNHPPVEVELFFLASEVGAVVAQTAPTLLPAVKAGGRRVVQARMLRQTRKEREVNLFS